MSDHTPTTAPRFGGRWTLEKLDILERYLDAYTNALRNQDFQLVYVDAFAGTGEISREAVERTTGVDEIVERYKAKLKEVFQGRLLKETQRLYNSKNSPMFEFIFCVGSSSPSAIQIAKRIAKHIIGNL